MPQHSSVVLFPRIVTPALIEAIGLLCRKAFRDPQAIFRETTVLCAIEVDRGAPGAAYPGSNRTECCPALPLRQAVHQQSELGLA